MFELFLLKALKWTIVWLVMGYTFSWGPAKDLFRS